jgi:hypothetical protein
MENNINNVFIKTLLSNKKSTIKLGFQESDLNLKQNSFSSMRCKAFLHSPYIKLIEACWEYSKEEETSVTGIFLAELSTAAFGRNGPIHFS